MNFFNWKTKARRKKRSPTREEWDIQRIRTRGLRLVIATASTIFCALSPICGAETIHLKTGYILEAASTVADGEFLRATVGTGELQFRLSDVASIEKTPISAPNAITAKQDHRPTLEDLIAEAAKHQGISASFLRSVAIVESGMRTGAISAKGALGVMQLMPNTAAELKVDPRSAVANITGGATYLRKLLLQYGGDSGLALAAYNAGPGTVRKYGGIPPYRETYSYVRKVITEYERQLKSEQLASVQSLHPRQ